jgi:signal transduction histidine kinase
MQFERIQSLANMVAGLAHKINTPLGVVNTANGMLLELANELDQTPVRQEIAGLLADVRDTTGLLGRTVRRVSQLMATFKQLSASQLTDERMATDLIDLVKDCANSIAHPDGIVIKTSSDDGPLAWVGYPAHLTQVLTTLLQNAVRHAYKGRLEGKIEVRIIREERTCVLEVEDYGVGVPAETLPRLFEPFAVWSDSNELGLGLAVTHNIVTRLLSGEVSCTSVVGKGPKFVVRIPLEVPVVNSHT